MHFEIECGSNIEMNLDAHHFYPTTALTVGASIVYTPKSGVRGLEKLHSTKSTGKAEGSFV